MKSSFKYTIRIILGTLVLILIAQVFWLAKLYESIGEELSKDVLQCIELSDRSELVLRMKDVNASRKDKEKISISLKKSINESDDSNDLSHNDSRTNTIADMEFLNLFMKDLGFVIHQTLDSIQPINLENLDSLITLNFKKRDIKAQLYYTDVVDLKNDSAIIKTSKHTFDREGKDKKIIYEYADNGRYAYIIHIEPLFYTILFRMSGILVTTVLIILILSLAFWYLLRTIFRQKTLEEMKDDFINNMTHELKTPIAVAYSATDTLLHFKQGDDKEKRNKYLTICKEQLSELEGLVELILSMSIERRQTFVLNKEDIHIADLVNNLIADHRLKSDKQLHFNLRINPEHLVIHADRIHFNNIISNLIDNAIKYSGESVNIAIDIYQKEKYNIIKVSDNGIGIPIEKQPYVFDKFYRVTQGNKYAVKGYGLGLYYAKIIIEKHNGIIFVGSNKHQGTIFTIQIPI